MQIVKDVRFGTDYVDGDGVLHTGGTGGVLVRNDTDVGNLPDSYSPGTMAHTAGWVAAWEKKYDGSWINIKGGSDIDA